MGILGSPRVRHAESIWCYSMVKLLSVSTNVQFWLKEQTQQLLAFPEFSHVILLTGHWKVSCGNATTWKLTFPWKTGCQSTWKFGFEYQIAQTHFFPVQFRNTSSFNSRSQWSAGQKFVVCHGSWTWNLGNQWYLLASVACTQQIFNARQGLFPWTQAKNMCSVNMEDLRHLWGKQDSSSHTVLLP